MIKILVLISCIIFTFCTSHSVKEKKNDFELQKKYQYVHLIPDSLRTPQQQKLYGLILETVVYYLKVENNHLVFSLSKKEFLKKGIPKPYYDLLQHNLKEANHFVDSVGVKGLDSILNESYRELYLKFKGDK